MDIGAAIEWIVGMPIIVLAIAIALWWLLGRNDKGLCPNCSSPRIFGDKCISCGNISVDPSNQRK